jgi:hypothetical protein
LTFVQVNQSLLTEHDFLGINKEWNNNRGVKNPYKQNTLIEAHHWVIPKIFLEKRKVTNQMKHNFEKLMKSEL